MTEEQINQYRTQIEEDLAWRTEEIALFSNQVDNIKPTNTSDAERIRADLEQKKFRKLLVLILYAHFEGFFRYAFSQYVNAINDADVDISKATGRLVTSSLHKVFEDYDTPNKWIIHDSSDFSKINKRIENRQVLLNEIKIHEKGKLKLHISSNHKDKTSLTHTESNLNYEVVSKILYRLDLELSSFHFDEKFKSSLSQFLNKRNSIAHGDEQYKNGIEKKDYDSYKKLFDDAVKFISIVITNCLREKRYLKPEYRTEL